MTELVDMANHAAAQSDRWLLVALGILAIAGIGFLWRWMSAQYQKTLDTWRSDMAAMQAEIRGLHAERIAAGERYAEALAKIAIQHASDQKELWKEVSTFIATNTTKMGEVTRALQELQVKCRRNATQ